jgi:hypothetical protein
MVLAATTSSLITLPAYADHNDQGGHNRGQEGNQGQHGNGHYQHDGRHHDNRREGGPGYYPYMYAQPVYVPPPVYYPPMPSPGISLFFPIELR